LSKSAFNSTFKLSILLFVFCAYPTLIYAQITRAPAKNTATVTDSVDFAFLPALAYNSDFGLMGGGILSRHHYKNNQSPFYSYVLFNAIVSTKGLFSSSVIFDKPKVFNTTQRLTIEGFLARFLQNQYYGIGNYQKLPDAPEGNPDYYLFNSFSAGLDLTVRRPLIEFNNQAQLDLFGLLSFEYRTPWGNEGNRLIMIDEPQGIDGAQSSVIGAGLIWENRNSEFDPTTGTYFKGGVETGQEFLGGSSNFFALKTDARAYTSFYLIRNITFANRISFNHTSGSLPYWKYSELGGELNMRGYPENRFRDHNALFLNTELRTWLIEFKSVDIRLGGTLFMDVGRTFPNGMPLSSVFDDLKYTFGFGGNSSFLNPNFILRGDVGFSEEGYGVYFTAGYMF
jgi:outer membrane protein assembly factor BamA